MTRSLFCSLLLLLGQLSAAEKDPNFFEKPYLQLGNRPFEKGGDLDLQWLAHDRDSTWTVEYKQSGDWKRASVKMLRRVAVQGTDPHRVMVAALNGLSPNTRFEYRILVGGKEVFASSAMSRKDKTANSRTVIFGDTAADTAGQRAVAYYSHKEQPDMVLIPGDIVYSRGRVSEYQEKFWPFFNSDSNDLKSGAPLLRSTLIAGVVGNHDVGTTIDFTVNPDALAYYYYWNQPMNGPALKANGPNTPKLKGSESAMNAFLQIAGANFPKGANFSFDYGKLHWTVIDSNTYTDWTTPEFRAWLKKDLAAAKDAAWRIVTFHHPPFNSSKAHGSEQRQRVINDILEEGKVAIVFAGHVHNYQRTHPLKFEVAPGFVLGKENKVPGKWTLDKSYDGIKNTKPNGVIHIVTGAGGARLYNEDQTNKPDSWEEFTVKFISNVHSFTVLDAEEGRLTIRQISAEGNELDKFIIEK
jgi:predicted phosphodiesterase